MNTTVPDVQKLTALFIETFLSFQPDFERENRVADAGRPHRQGPHQEAPRPGANVIKLSLPVIYGFL
jgi:hypothetical protein